MLFPLRSADLTVSYQKKPVLYGVDLEVEEGSLVGIIGPNGAGKSTLIKTIMNRSNQMVVMLRYLEKPLKQGSSESAISLKKNLLTGTFR